jgi:prepilin-type N-terminal cleavage/methylation domain-containing protein
MIKSFAAARRRAGFTLIETIVTVGLIAVLAAFVIPTVVQKAQAADPVKISNDVNAIGTGLDNFLNDTKAGYPSQIWEITARPTTANTLIDHTTLLTASQIALWNGPYLGSTIGTADGDSLPTGYTAFIANRVERYDAQNNKGEISGGTGSTFSTTNTLFVTIKITGLTLTQATTVNVMIDGPSDVNVSSGLNTGANITGRFRFDPPNANNIVVAYYLASPIT